MTIYFEYTRDNQDRVELPLNSRVSESHQFQNKTFVASLSDEYVIKLNFTVKLKAWNHISFVLSWKNIVQIYDLFLILHN